MRFLVSSVFVLFGLVLILPSPALAQYKVSTNEDIAIAFFKTAGSPPNYVKLAKGAKAYRRVPVVKQQAFIAKEKERLVKLYHDFDPASDLLTVRTTALIELNTQLLDDGTEKHSMVISFPQGDAQFFPYAYQDYNIAIIPQQLSDSLVQPLAPSQHALMLADFTNQINGTATLDIQMKPVKSYLDQPYKIGGKEQWALLANVAGMTLSGKGGERLWTFSAPWYVSPVTEDLRDMYSDEQIRKKDVMEKENPLRPLE